MNNNKVSNPKTEVPTGIKMNDKDYITCLLTILKDMVKNYTIAMTEASNENLYQSYNSTFQKLIELQRETFELMFRKGWYSLEKVELPKISEKYQTLSQAFLEILC